MATPKRSALGMIVLGMLVEEPQHAYRIQQTLVRHGKDRVVNIRQRASLYQTIDRLQRLGLIRVRETVRDGNHPDRTVYEATAAGREAAWQWLDEMLLATEEFPEFVAALSVVVGMTPAAAADRLHARAEIIAARLAEAEESIRVTTEALTRPRDGGPVLDPDLSRVVLLEDEYRRVVLGAELGWLTSVVDDLRTGRFAWDADRLRAFAAAFEEEHENAHANR